MLVDTSEDCSQEQILLKSSWCKTQLECESTNYEKHLNGSTQPDQVLKNQMH